MKSILKLHYFLPIPLAIAQSCTSHGSIRENDERPNIIVIYTDDVGYGDISCYGSPYVETPEIDRIALNGLRFTNAYATSATCTPSRHGLLTGEYPWRRPDTRIARGDAAMIIKPGTITIPSVLKELGYSTAVVGKWHLGLGPDGGPDWNAEIRPGPEDLGFDYAFLIPATGDRVPCVYLENRRVVGLDPNDPIQVSFSKKIGHDSTIYNPEAPPDRIVIYDHPSEAKPGAPGARTDMKMHPSAGHDKTIVNGISRIGYMTGGYAARWRDEDMADVITERALNYIENNKNNPFFLYFSTHDNHVPRMPHERFKGKSQIGVYGDVLMQLDWCVGEILNKLVDLKLTNQTLVIFTSDNGPVLNDGYFDGTVENIGQHKPAGPLRGMKYSAFEGGTRIPFLIQWPGKIQPGISTAQISQIDLLASFASLAGHQAPESLSSDSYNHLAALLGNDPVGRETIIEQNAQSTLSIIHDNWKYIEPSNAQMLNPITRPPIELGNNPKPQLYNLLDDIGEKQNLAEKHPEKVAELAGMLKKVRGKSPSGMVGF
jgi:arylsulfatase A-like enzyme